jgi:hypothetical protein
MRNQILRQHSNMIEAAALFDLAALVTAGLAPEPGERYRTAAGELRTATDAELAHARATAARILRTD